MNDYPERAPHVKLPPLGPTDVAANRELWCRALESGEFEQCRNRLRTPLGYCCLGVAETLRGASWHRRSGDGFEHPLDPAEVEVDATTYERQVVEYYLRNERIYLTDPVTGEQLTRTPTGALTPRPLYVGDPNQQTGTMLSGRGARWLGLLETDPYVAVYDGGAWTSTTLSTLNDQRRFNFPRLAAVIRDQPASWTGQPLEAANLARDRVAAHRPPPRYVAESA